MTPEENKAWIDESGQINPDLIDVLVSRVDAHRLLLAMNHKGELIRDNVRFWITPLPEGKAFKVVDYKKPSLEEFNLWK